MTPAARPISIPAEDLEESVALGIHMYVRDPACNLVEVDRPDATTLDPLVVVGDIRSRHGAGHGR